MLSKRANILFDEVEFKHLAQLAHELNTSVGQLVRKAVQNTYLSPQTKKRLKQSSSYHSLLSWQKKVGYQRGIDYKQLIEYSRSRSPSCS